MDKSIMDVHNVVKKISGRDFLGDPQGIPAYAYARVSSDEQAEQSASGIPRQLEHIHDAAIKEGLRISLDLVFFDDASGFSFEGRPALTKLRREYAQKNRRANYIVMEYLDRLSRNGDWHQGYLLDEMKKHNITPLFWKTFSSRIERAVMGAISQDGMEQAKERMAQGTVYKANSGRITAKSPAYGYRFVDSNGGQENVRKDTHYAIDPVEAPIVKYIFEQIAFHTDTLRHLAADLTQKGIATPRGGPAWESKVIHMIIKNELYKGEFIAHRYTNSKARTASGANSVRVERPPEEWIRIPVEPIVSVDVWELANQVLVKNKEMSIRSSKNPFLLTGLVKCAICGFAYRGANQQRKGRHMQRSYRCSSKIARGPDAKKRINCTAPEISAGKLDKAVWGLVCDLLLHPEIIISYLDSTLLDDHNVSVNQQIAFMEGQMAEFADDEQKMWKAYKAGVFDEHEYAAKRMDLKKSVEIIKTELASLRGQVRTHEDIEVQKQIILKVASQAKSSGFLGDVPFDIQQRIIKMVVDKIILNTKDGSLQLEGAINGIWELSQNGNLLRSPADR